MGGLVSAARIRGPERFGGERAAADREAKRSERPTVRGVRQREAGIAADALRSDRRKSGLLASADAGPTRMAAQVRAERGLAWNALLVEALPKNPKRVHLQDPSRHPNTV